MGFPATSYAVIVMTILLAGHVTGQSEDKGAKESAENRVVVYDGANFLSGLLNAMLFFTQGEATIIAPLSNTVLYTPMIGLVLLYFLLLFVFYEYNTGAFLGPARTTDEDVPFLNRDGFNLDHANIEAAGSIISSLNRAGAKYQNKSDGSP